MMIKLMGIFFQCILIFCCSISSFSQLSIQTVFPGQYIQEGEALGPSFYKSRYHTESLFNKITDNKGNGFDSLYGTRNMRNVLYGVLYRGGANNYYHKENKRKNHNPMPDDGLLNLCSEGFSNIVYLYRHNFDSTSAINWCQSINGKINQMVYQQLDYFDSAHIYQMLELTHKSIVDSTIGPVYLHCWNGWHASGLLAALSLRQFCDFSPVEAMKYWDLGTDGANISPRYQAVRDKIVEFKPYSQFKTSVQTKQKICPVFDDEVSEVQVLLTIDHVILAPETIAEGQSVVLNKITFNENDSIIDPDSNQNINKLIKLLKDHPNWNVELGIYKDNLGEASQHKKITHRRGAHLNSILLKNGILATQFSIKSYGSIEPLMSNKSKVGREANNRIQLKILKKESENLERLINDLDDLIDGQ